MKTKSYFWMRNCGRGVMCVGGGTGNLKCFVVCSIWIELCVQSKSKRVYFILCWSSLLYTEHQNTGLDYRQMSVFFTANLPYKCAFFLSNVYLVSKLKAFLIPLLILVSIIWEKKENYHLQNLQVTSSYWESKQREGQARHMEWAGLFCNWVDLSCGPLKTTEDCISKQRM